MDQHQFRFLLDGEEYFERYCELIEKAENQIIIHTYIYKLDRIGDKILNLLIRKAKEKVWVNLLIDYFGSFELDHQAFLKLNSIPHFEVKFFNVFRFPRYVFSGRRLHHKTLIVDEKIGILSGINILDSFDPEFPGIPRLDFGLEMKGEVVKDIHHYCLAISNRKRKQKVFKTSRKSLRKYEELGIKLLINDWLKNRKQITVSYLNLIKTSEKEILLIHGYFFPMNKMIKLMCKKAQQGVSVKLLLPQYSDWRSWLWASEFLYHKLIKSGVRVYLWKKSILHGKLALADHSRLNLGSHNLNYTSSFGNLEMNIELYNVEEKIPNIYPQVAALFREEDCFELLHKKRIFYPLIYIRNLLAYYLLKAVAGFFKGLILRAKKL